MPQSTFEMDLKKVRGLGSDHRGFKHWWAQRLSGIALIPLTLWFIKILYGAPDELSASHEEWVTWVTAPINSILLLALVIASGYHAYLGLVIVVQDYVHSLFTKTILLVSLRLGLLALTVLGVWAVFSLCFVKV